MGPSGSRMVSSSLSIARSCSTISLDGTKSKYLDGRWVDRRGRRTPGSKDSLRLIRVRRRTAITLGSPTSSPHVNSLIGLPTSLHFIRSGTPKAPAANYIRPPTNIFLLLPIASSRWLLFSNVTCLSIMCSTYATASVPRCTRCGIQVRKKKKKKKSLHLPRILSATAHCTNIQPL